MRLIDKTKIFLAQKASLRNAFFIRIHILIYYVFTRNTPNDELSRSQTKHFGPGISLLPKEFYEPKTIEVEKVLLNTIATCKIFRTCRQEIASIYH
jgi:hypothetical protein